MGTAFKVYENLIEHGVATESARFVLPLATQTKIYMAGTIRSWIHYLELRCDPHTQQEHREIALLIRSGLAVSIPTVAKALEWPE
jgi:thymidylate synthase (FAD)